MGKALIWAIRKYQKLVSPTKPACCRYTPTCSEYAIQAITVHGAFVGSILAILRILRCNPLFKGGYDPVPPRYRPKQKNNNKKK